jgi:predicted short-subunit dehydrogenase-like oxidoreductase (DUF2520 family)
MITVTLLGAGNVASHLFKAFYKAGNVTVKQWFNRSIKTLQPYKNEVTITDDITTLTDADIYILAVSDDAISMLSNKLPFEDRLVVHTSGSVNIHDLDKRNRRGVLYPLQTFSKEVDMDFSNVPICLETLEKSDLSLLRSLTEGMNAPNFKVNTEQRQTLHLAAVFVNNFVNQLYRIGH